MSVVNLPEELFERLAAEAAQLGTTVDELARRSLAERYEAASPGAGREAIDALIGSEDSGDPGWASRPSADLRTEAAARRDG